MIKREYSQEYKLTVIQEYIRSPHGIRVVARSFGLPSKNYITNWLKELVALGLVSEEELIVAGKKSSANRGKKSHPYEVHLLTPREKMLEQENLRLRAELDFLKKLDEIERRDAKIKKPIEPFSN